MGCDIHLCFEKKNAEGKWERIEIDEKLIPDERDYDIFSFLTGIRGSLEGNFTGRGLPEDATVTTREDCEPWMGDHSYTHAYLDEILNARWGEAGLGSSYFYLFCSEILPRLACSSRFCNSLEKRNIRVLMGFDS